MESVIIELPPELFAPAAYAHFEGECAVDVLKAGPDLYTFEQPVAWRVDVSNTGDALLLQGEVQGVGATCCARCLDAADVDFFAELDGYYLLDAASAAPEDLEGDEFDVVPADRRIDIAPLIHAALLLEVPYLPLCAEDCAGLCPACGANLNEGACGCAAEADSVDATNPFAVLKGLVLS